MLLLLKSFLLDVFEFSQAAEVGKSKLYVTDTTGTEAGAVSQMQFPDGAVTISGNTAVVVIGGAGLETDPVYSLWNKSTGISITSGQVSNFENTTTTIIESYGFLTTYTETDPVYSAWDKTITSGQISNWSTATSAFLTTYNETDPVFSAWDKSAGVSITNGQVSNWSTATSAFLTTYNETDPVYGAWDKSSGISITSGQVSNFSASTTALIEGYGYIDTETDPVYGAWDKSSGITITSGQVSNFNAATTALIEGYGYIDTESDPVYGAWNKTSGITISASQVSDFNSTATALIEGYGYSTLTNPDVSITTGQITDFDSATTALIEGYGYSTLTNPDVSITSGQITDFTASVTALVEGYSYLTDAVTSINGMTDATQTFAAGSNITITSLNGTTTIASTASGGGVESINALTGAIDIVAGSNVTITSLGTTVTVSATGGGGVDTIVAGESISVSGATGDVTVSVVKLVDLVAGSGLSGGANDILPGSDADITVSVLASDSTITVTASGIAVGTLADSNIPDAITLSSSATVDAGAIKSGTVTASVDAGSKTLEIPNGTSLPATCNVGEVYSLSNASANEQFYVCSASNTWSVQNGTLIASRVHTEADVVITAAYQNISFSAERYDYGDLTTASITPTSRFTITETGIYAIGGGVTFHATANTDEYLKILKNGGTDAIWHWTSAQGNRGVINSQTVLNLGDYVEFALYASTTTTAIHANSYTVEFWIAKIGNSSSGSTSGEGASVYNNADITITTGGWYSLTFNSEDYDTLSLHSTVSNTDRLTISSTGIYAICGNLQFQNNSTGVRAGRILLNGTTPIALNIHPANTLTYDYMPIYRIRSLNANDYLQLQVYQNSGGGLNIEYGNDSGQDSPYFTIERLR